MLDDFALTPPADDDGVRAPTTRDAATAHRAKTIDIMRRRYGAGPEGATCGACVSLVRSGGGDGSWPKCTRFRISCSAATDWRLRWPACGKFTPREETASDGE